MKTKLLETGSPEDVRTYLTKKFKKFNSGFYLKKTRRKKCILYYLAASTANQTVVESIYFVTFKEQFPRGEADRVEDELERKASRPQMIERSEYISRKVGRIADAEEPLAPPLLEAVHPYAQQFDIVPARYRAQAIGGEGEGLGQVCAKGMQTYRCCCDISWCRPRVSCRLSRSG